MIILIVLLVLCGIADIATTLRGLRNGDSEANPLVAPVIGLLGPVPALLLIKVVCTGTIVGVLLLRPAWWPFGAFLLGGYVLVLRNNLKVLKQDAEGS